MTLPALNFRRVLLIARRDYFGYIKTWGFWISFVLPFILGGLFIGAQLLGINVTPTRYETILDNTGQHASAILKMDAERQDELAAMLLDGVGQTILNDDDKEKLQTLIDEQGIEGAKDFIDTKIPGASKKLNSLESKLIFVPSPARDIAALKPYLRGEKTLNYEGKDVKLNGVLHIYNDGELKADYWSSNVTDNPVERLARDYFQDIAVVKYLETGGLNKAELKAVQTHSLDITSYDPTKEETTDGTGQEVTATDRIPYLVAFALSMFLWLTVFSGAYMLLTSMLEEKMNKLLEMMLATTRFSEIIMGKLLGVAGLTVTAILPYIIMGIVGVVGFIFYGDPEIAQGLIQAFSLKMIVFFLIFLVLGYIFYGALFIALGALAESMQDAQTLTTPIMFVLMGAMFVVPIGLRSPDSPLLIFASWFPLSSPFAMIMRLPSDPPLWQLITSVGVLFVCTIGVVMLAGRIFRFGVLSGSGVKVATDWFKRTILRRKTN